MSAIDQRQLNRVRLFVEQLAIEAGLLDLSAGGEARMDTSDLLRVCESGAADREPHPRAVDRTGRHPSEKEQRKVKRYLPRCSCCQCSLNEQGVCPYDCEKFARPHASRIQADARAKKRVRQGNRA